MFSDSQLSALTASNIAVSCVSMIGSLIIIICFWQFKELRSFAFRLVFYSAIADFFFSVGQLFGDPATGSGACGIQSFLIGYFGLAALLWTCAIAFTLYMAVVKEAAGLQQLMWRYSVVCWGAPLPLAVLPWSTDSYGDTGGQCWLLNSSHGDKAWRFLQYLIPLWAAIIFNSTVIFAVRKRVLAMTETAGTDATAEEAAASRKRAQAMLARIRLYPLVWVITNLFSTINALYELGGSQNYTLTMFDVLLSSSQGFFNALVYGLTPTIRDRIVLFCQNRQPDAAPDGRPRDGEAEEYIDEEEHSGDGNAAGAPATATNDATKATPANDSSSGRESNGDEHDPNSIALTVTNQ